MIASGGSDGEIFIWDLNSLATAFAPGRTPTRNNDIDAIAWNNNVAHILASGSSEGTSIWDLKNRKEVLHLNFQSPTGTNSRNLISSIAWHPDNSTTLITASSDENSPVILLWDLRNANAPQKVIQGHDKGVLSIDWCKQDSSFLLSSGKDNKTLLWNPLTGEKLGDYPVTSNWNFQTSFNPNIPDIFASASFDGKISVQTLQDTNSKDETQKKGEGDDFWNSNSYIDAQHPTVSLKKAPKWLIRPCSVSFGFGGKVVSVKKTGDNQSQVSISKFSGDESLISDTSKLATALNSDSVSDIISKQIEESKGPENFDWSVLQALSTSDSKKAIEKYIGETNKDEESKEPKDEEKTESKEGGLFGDDATTEDEFLSSLSLNKGYEPSGTFKIFDPKYSTVEKNITDAILAGNLEKAVKIALKEDMLSEAFSIACSSTDNVRNLVQSAYLSKNAESKPYLRLLYSISSNDLTDVVKNSDIDEWKVTLKTILNLAKDAATFKKHTSLLGERLLEARNSLSDPTSDKAVELRNNAVLCFLASEDLAKTSSVWIKEISDKETSLLKDDSNELTPYAAHVKALHAFIEKITIFRKTAKSIGNDSSDDLAPLYDIYRDYANIVATQGQLDLAQTFLNFLPDKYASLERDRVSKANKNGTAVSAKPKAATSTYSAYGATSSFKYPAKPATANPFGASTAAPTTPAAAAPAPGSASGNKSPYAPTNATPSNPYAPPPVTTQPPTGPGYQPSPRSPATSKFQPGHNKTPSGIYPPPNPIIDSYQPVEAYKKANAISPPPTGPPPTSSQINPNKNAGGWNDLPSSAIPPPRKVTPAAPAVTGSPFGFGSNPYAPAPAPPSAYGRQTPAQLGPPPTGPVAKSEPPTMSASSSMSTPSNPSTTDKYAPVKPASPQLPKSTPHGGPGAYGEPPRNFGTPPVNPYAAPSITSPPPNPYAPRAGQPQPQGYNSFQSPPTNGYGAPPQAAAPSMPPSNPYAPAPGVPSQAPPMRPTSGFGASAAYPPQPPQAGGYAPQPIQPQQPQPPAQPEPKPEPEKPAAPKYPPGDRSHIPENARPIFEILSQRLEDVKPKIPPSYQRQVQDAEKRLNLLFDHLNNEDLLSQDTITDMLALSQALQNNDFETASEIHLSILTTRSDECGHWMVGLKRLIDISRVLYTTAAGQQY